MKRILLMALVGLVALGLWTGTAMAQGNDVITASVDRTTVTTDDLVTLTVTIDRGAGASEPTPPALDGFSVLGTSSGTQISIVNGDMSVQMAYTYFLQPMQIGDLIIDPFTTTANGQTYQTDPILVTVTQGTGQFQPSVPSVPGLGGMIPSVPGAVPGGRGQQPSASGGSIQAPAGLNGQDYFVEAVVDKNTPWQGEQVLYTFRFYQGASLLVEPNLDTPEFTGFWHDRQSDQTTYTTEAGGRTYYVTELQTVLFPTVSGEVTIEPAVLEIPGGFFSSGQTLSTQPVTVNVRPLPDNPPAGFEGAVGQFGLQSLVDKTTSQVNDAVTLQVTLSGVGNMDTLADLTWDVGPEWRAFDPEVESTSDFTNGQLQGNRIYKQLLVPTVSGSLTIEPITFSYFDPLLGEYETITTQPIVIQVSADPNAGSQSLPAVGSGAVTGVDIAGLRPLKAAPSSWRNTPGFLVSKTGYWLLFAIPLLMLVGVAGYGAASAYRRRTADDRHRSRAAKQAYDGLKQARKHPAEAAAAGAKVLNAYLTTKLGQPTVGLTRQGLGTVLHEHGISDELIARVQHCMENSDTVAYFPGSAEGTESLLDDIEAVIRDLDEVIE
ncbi:MAG: BatD family protein [Chloroflexota bacterium]